MTSADPKTYLIKILPFSLLFLLYGFLTYPCIYFWDSGEFSFISTFLGVPHPTGYPLYIQLLKLFSFLPVGSPYFLQNLFSAIFATLASVVLFKLCYQITNHYQASLVASLSFALSPVVLNNAIMAEVYTLQVFIVICVIYLGYSLLCSWDVRKIWTISFLLGIGISHHMTTIFLSPAFLFLLIITPKETRNLKTYLFIIVFGLIGLSPYLFILFRNHLAPPPFWPKWFGINMNTLSDWYWLLSGKLHRVEMSSFSIFRYVKEFGFFGYLLFRDFYWLGGIIGLFGLLKYFKIQLIPAIFLSLVFFSHLAFFIHYNIPDIADYYTIAYSFWAIWFAIGLKYLILMIESHLPSIKPSFIRSGSLAFLFIPLILLVQSHQIFLPHMTSLAYTHKVFSHPKNGFILFTSGWTSINSIWFFQQLTPIRPDIEIFDQVLVYLRERARLAEILNPKDKRFSVYVANNFKNKIEQKIIEQINLKEDVYVDNDLGFLHEKFYQKKIFDGFNRIVLKNPPKMIESLPENVIRTSLVFNSSLQFLGYTISPASQVEGEFYVLRLFWRIIGPVPNEVGGIIKFQLKDGSNSTKSQEGFPLEFTLGSGLSLPSEWPKNKIIEESFQSTTKSVRSGTYEISMILVDKETKETIPLDNFPNFKDQAIFFRIGETKIATSPDFKYYWDKK